MHVQEPVSIAASVIILYKCFAISLWRVKEKKDFPSARFLDAIDFRVANHMAIENYV